MSDWSAKIQADFLERGIAPPRPKPEDSMGINNLALSYRVGNILCKAGIVDVRQLRELERQTIAMLPGIGPRALAELDEAMKISGSFDYRSWCGALFPKPTAKPGGKK